LEAEKNSAARNDKYDLNSFSKAQYIENIFEYQLFQYHYS